ncbi:MAG: DUF692 family protein [Alphaproteobacteria bacterium]|nr:DUF692 family protein [Alphaproteobacteria bacterium]
MSALGQNSALARAAGVGLKPQHYAAALAGGHGLGFFEVHAENFMSAGGPPHRWLSAVRAEHYLSVHGVCLSVGGRDDLDEAHLARLAELVRRYEPALVSEHLAWSADGGVFFNDLLPPPLTQASLARACRHVDQIQSALGRTILIENPSIYLPGTRGDIPEPEFLNELARRTGCGVLLDINNVFVSAENAGFDASAYLDAIDPANVGEIHLAGHAIDNFEGVSIRVDNHGSAMCDEVVALYERFIARAGPRPTLIEWDHDTPAFDVLLDETRRAKVAMMRALFEESVADVA